MVRYFLAILLLVTLAACRMQQTEVVFDLGPLGNAMKACTDGDADQCFTAGEMMERGVDGEVSHEGAFNMYEKACEAGHPIACNNAGALVHAGRVSEGADVAVRLFKRGCEAGNAPGCHNLAVAYRHGRGTAEDHSLALAFALKGCEAGSPGACVNAAMWGPRATASEREEAQARLARACELGAEGCLFQGLTLIDGTLGVTDPVTGSRLVYRACEAGSHVACVDLAAHVVADRAPLPDGAPAVPDLLTSACSGGVIEGCRGAAQVYREGIGVPVDLEQARTWARRACELGDEAFCETP